MKYLGGARGNKSKLWKLNYRRNWRIIHSKKKRREE